MDRLEHERAVPPAEVERQLAELWRKAASDDEPVIRACRLNLVACCAGPDDLNEVTRAIALLSEEHPARAIVVCADPETSEDRLLAYVSAHCHIGAGKRRVCSEQVTLEARGESVDLVPDTILQLVREDLPVHTWWRRPHLADDPLLRRIAELSDRLVLDAARFAEPESAVRALASLTTSRGGKTSDLAWLRIEGWREAAASWFDSPSTRGHLDRLTSVSVVAGGPASGGGFTAAGGYFAGWLASRLGWTPTPRTPGSGGRSTDRWRRKDGREVEIHLEGNAALEPGEIGVVRLRAGEDAAPVAFVAERLGRGADTVRLAIETPGSPPLARTLKLPTREVVALLCGAIERRTDPVFEAALAEASGLASGGPSG